MNEANLIKQLLMALLLRLMIVVKSVKLESKHNRNGGDESFFSDVGGPGLSNDASVEHILSMKNKCNFSVETFKIFFHLLGAVFMAELERYMIKQIIIHGARISMDFIIVSGC